MFNIHGGGLHRGSAKSFSGSHLLERDVVLVNIQYRLAPLGFLTTQTDDMPGNLGLHDCVMALNWVKSYIQHFGGDPDQITIFGESAGGLLVSALVLSMSVPDRLFQKAIIQSGTLFVTNSIKENPLELAKTVAQQTDCEKKETIPEISNCLREVSLLSLLKAYEV